LRRIVGFGFWFAWHEFPYGTKERAES
jgi:hypothetical protein